MNAVTTDPTDAGSATAPRRRAGFAPFVTLLIAAIAALGLTLATAPAAHAHSELVSSSPADGESLAAAPANVTLQFNEAISPAGLQVVAQGPDGPVTLGTPLIEGATVITPWPADAPGGDYRLAYRVVSADGHPIDGSISFSYAATAAANAATEANAAPGAAAPEPSDLGQSALASENTAAPQPADTGFPWWVAVVAVIVGVGIGAVIARTMRARAAKNQ